MNAQHLKHPDSDQPFGAADEHRQSMKDSLTSRGFDSMSEASVERWVDVEGHELLRRLLQAHITLRGPAQVVGPVVGADAVERTHVRKGKTRRLGTVFGPVEVERTACGASGVGPSPGGCRTEPAV